MELEEHEGRVTWAAPVAFDEGVDPQQLEIAGGINAQACATSCLPPENMPFTAAWSDAPPSAPAKVAGSEAYVTGEVSFRGRLEPKVAAPGGKVKLILTAEPTDGWHIYEFSDRVGDTASRPTLLAITETPGLEIGSTFSDPEPHHAKDNPVGEHDEPVTWTTELTVPNSIKPGEYKIAGALAYQTCLDEACKAPTGVHFETTLNVDFNSADGSVPVLFTGKASYREVQMAAAPSRGLDLEAIKPAGVEQGNQSLWLMLGTAFLGGLILNLMPCVLPVIGLKVLSFVEQGGRNRQQVFWLNVWYSLGLLSVFLLLATLPVVSRLWFGRQFGWGEQFSYYQFNITLAAVVFAMALSFLGVWEIPIPGFVGSGKADDLAARKAAPAPSAKAPSPPFWPRHAAAHSWAPRWALLFAQPAHVTYAMFACMGLGMASPYLLIGAFPQLIRFLPKPGAWMDTFKQLMGFVLLGTVVYLMTLIPQDKVIPTFAFLIGLWAACWWIGRTPVYADFGAKLRAWAGAIVVATTVGCGAFISFFEAEELAWKPFSVAELERLTGEGKTVMVDFTADWCVTCKALERLVLNTAETKEVVQTHGIETLVADMTDYPPEESDLLIKLSGGKAVPVLAIFPAARPKQPIVLKDSYTKGLLYEKLKEAGPSKDAGRRPLAAAMKVK